jgi:hypothetical protein
LCVGSNIRIPNVSQKQWFFFAEPKTEEAEKDAETKQEGMFRFEALRNNLQYLEETIGNLVWLAKFLPPGSELSDRQSMNITSENLDNHRFACDRITGPNTKYYRK